MLHRFCAESPTMCSAIHSNGKSKSKFVAAWVHSSSVVTLMRAHMSPNKLNFQEYLRRSLFKLENSRNVLRHSKVFKCTEEYPCRLDSTNEVWQGVYVHVSTEGSCEKAFHLLRNRAADHLPQVASCRKMVESFPLKSRWQEEEFLLKKIFSLLSNWYHINKIYNDTMLNRCLVIQFCSKLISIPLSND